MSFIIISYLFTKNKNEGDSWNNYNGKGMLSKHIYCTISCFLIFEIFTNINLYIHQLKFSFRKIFFNYFFFSSLLHFSLIYFIFLNLIIKTQFLILNLPKYFIFLSSSLLIFKNSYIFFLILLYIYEWLCVSCVCRVSVFLC